MYQRSAGSWQAVGRQLAGGRAGGSQLSSVLKICIISCLSHQTTKQPILFPQIFYKFFSVWTFEKQNKLFIGPKLRKNLFWTNKKFIFLYSIFSLSVLNPSAIDSESIEPLSCITLEIKIWVVAYFFNFFKLFQK